METNPRPRRRVRALLIRCVAVAAALTLGGCVVAPYGPYYYRPHPYYYLPY